MRSNSEFCHAHARVRAKTNLLQLLERELASLATVTNGRRGDFHVECDRPVPGSRAAPGSHAARARSAGCASGSGDGAAGAARRPRARAASASLPLRANTASSRSSSCGRLVFAITHAPQRPARVCDRQRSHVAEWTSVARANAHPVYASNERRSRAESRRSASAPASLPAQYKCASQLLACAVTRDLQSTAAQSAVGPGGRLKRIDRPHNGAYSSADYFLATHTCLLRLNAVRRRLTQMGRPSGANPLTWSGKWRKKKPFHHRNRDLSPRRGDRAGRTEPAMRLVARAGPLPFRSAVSKLL
jgi:hypothetical protein